MLQQAYYTWQDILTMPDDSLVGEGSVDAMGMQMIWSDFGQRIFNYRLTTISNNVRNYTLNLFHHHVIRKLGKRDPGFFHNAFRNFKSYRSESDVKAGILIFLEDLLAHLMVYMKFELGEDVNLEGVLGTNKAEHQYLNDKESIQLEAEKSKGVLVRQIVTGINGRYKGPFMSMGLLASRYFDYDEEAWGRAEQLLNNWESVAKLADLLVNELVDLFASGPDSYPRAPFVRFREDPALRDLYKLSFGSNYISDEFRHFWEGRIGLTEGASMALYQQMELPADTPPSIVYRKAGEDLVDPVEKAKIHDIILVEPFLSVCTQLFYRMSDPSTKYLDALKEETKELLNISNLKEVVPLSSSNPRLQLLVEHFVKGNNDPIETLRQIALYHKEVMSRRGTHPWLEIIGKDQIKHFTYQKAWFETQEFLDKKPWYHTYYLPTLRSIFNAMRGQ